MYMNGVIYCICIYIACIENKWHIYAGKFIERSLLLRNNGGFLESIVYEWFKCGLFLNWKRLSNNISNEYFTQKSSRYSNKKINHWNQCYFCQNIIEISFFLSVSSSVIYVARTKRQLLLTARYNVTFENINHRGESDSRVRLQTVWNRETAQEKLAVVYQFYFKATFCKTITNLTISRSWNPCLKYLS